jgi:hypothetical protein
MASDKAPGPDGYIGAFFRSAWTVIKGDVMAVVNFFYQQQDQHLKQLNSAHMVLLPKKQDASTIRDYHPISLTHSIAKLLSKLLANRLAPHLQDLVSRQQSAFIKKRNIQDNFLFTQNLIKALHKAKSPTLFLKLDIAKAFGSVRWDFLLEVLQQMGFDSRWRAWISILLSTASTSVLLNRARGPWFKHRTGLRQGDSLSPMLFILAMEPLQRMLAVATDEGLLSRIDNRAAKARMSLCADDVGLFLNPVEQEIKVLSEILADFAHASGLTANASKSAVYPIQCDVINVVEIMEDFDCPVSQFPCTYLGLPFHTRGL